MTQIYGEIVEASHLYLLIGFLSQMNVLSHNLNRTDAKISIAFQEPAKFLLPTLA